MNILKVNLKNIIYIYWQKKKIIRIQQKLTITNGIYKISESYKTFSNHHSQPIWFSKNNPFIIENINKYLEIEKNSNFICLSSNKDYINRDSILTLKCNRCDEIIKLSWLNASRNDEQHYGLSCKNCDGTIESLHASILKQLFQHYYPDTIVEEKSCRNPKTNRIMATDIVNHRMKIAIEVQGQYHKWKTQQERDKIKKNFWIDKGYNFYDYSIEKISTLDYAKLFFPNLTKLPDWINYKYGNKINIKQIQKMLDSLYSVKEISEKLSIKEHRIYDAIYSNKLHYNNSYIKKFYSPVVQLDKNRKYIRYYNSINEAENDNKIKKEL